MEFKKIQLNGFKSFADKTNFLIEDGLTGIVGPNGCGKSNIVESLRWVMGETSAKSMRGSGMEDVIFSGTSNRPEKNFSEVSIFFEDLETNSTASSQLRKQEGSYQDFYINYGVNYDLRNSRYNPSSGHNIYFNQELPIVSDNNEIANTFIITKYKNLSERSGMIGKASLYLKSINSLDGSDVRISKRGYIPYNRLRGFEKGKVGPIDNSDYIGGNYVGAINLSPRLKPFAAKAKCKAAVHELTAITYLLFK